MLPVTLTEPLNNADEAVTSPFALTLNLLELIKKSFPVAEPDIKKLVPLDKVLLLIVNPAILPPVNNTLLPVISPEAFTLNLLELIKNSLLAAVPDIKKLVLLDNELLLIVNPPISPAVAIIVPAINTSPSSSKTKLDDDIIKLPEFPLLINPSIYDVFGLPRKNVSVCISNSLSLVEYLK